MGSITLHHATRIYDLAAYAKSVGAKIVSKGYNLFLILRNGTILLSVTTPTP